MENMESPLKSGNMIKAEKMMKSKKWEKMRKLKLDEYEILMNCIRILDSRLCRVERKFNVYEKHRELAVKEIG